MMKISEFHKKDIHDAASLFCKQYKKTRRIRPELPDTYSKPESIIPLIASLLKTTKGIVVKDDRRLTGYFLGMTVPTFKSPHNGIYCPEWAHGASQDDRDLIYRQMYEEISKMWVKNGCYIHCLSIMVGDNTALETFNMMGFGITTVDAITNISKNYSNTSKRLKIKTITKGDIDDIMPLVRDLSQHVSSSPCFNHTDHGRDRDWYIRFLLDKDKSIWAAYQNDVIVSFMQCEPAPGAGTCRIVRDPRIMAITGAYTRTDFRYKGTSNAILTELLKDSQNKGYNRCSVDFESANNLAYHFWLKRFKPVCYSMLRYIDERAASSPH